MKLQLASSLKITAVLAGLTAFLFAGPADAQITTNNYIYGANQSGSPGTNWSGGPSVLAYWKLNNAGIAVQPASGTSTLTTTNYNFYNLTNNGTKLGNGTTITLIRNPYGNPSGTANTPNVVSFPGDSLILNTNTEIRFKHTVTAGTLVSGVTYGIPTNNFPGNFGQPGLVLNGGCLNNGDAGIAFVIFGTIYSVPGTVSYLNPGDTFAADGTLRSLVLSAQMSGSGTIALLNGTNNVPQPVNGTNNTFSGTWVVRAGWLQGAGDGTSDGYNALGTNAANTFIINPLWPVPNTFAAGSFFFNGPAILDMSASVANCSGSLVLTNGGQLYLHGNVIFQSVRIESTNLPNGTYSYSYLTNTFSIANGFSNNFVPVGFPAGSGTLTVQPPGSIVIPPSVVIQPLPEVLYPGRTASLTGTGNGSLPLSYQWLKSGVPIANGSTGTGSTVSGATSTNLLISNISLTDVANYSLIVSNLINTVTSTPASLNVVGPVEAYETAVTNLNPVAFYQFNESFNPASGTAEAFDFAGGFNGTYGVNVQNGFNSIVGPTSLNSFPDFVSTNLAANFTPSVAGGRVSVPSWNLNTNTVTMCAWINPSAAQLNAAGLVFCRGADTVAGLCYASVINAGTGVYDLGYNWNNDPSVYDWDSGLVAPVGQWSFVALVVSPNAATIYLMNTNGLTSSTHVYPHVNQAFSSADTTLIGDDSVDGGNGSRTFAGVMDDVAVFNAALTGDQVAALFYAASGVSSYPPVIGVQPLSTNVYSGQTVTLSAGAYGSEPLGYQWYAAVTNSGGPYTAVVNGAGPNGEFISGAQSATLTIQNIAVADTMDYQVIVTNTAVNGSATSGNATVVVTTANPPQNITLSAQEAAGTDWNTGGEWSDGNPASVSAASDPGSTYELEQGSRLRTPNNATIAVFPGNQLTNDGTGVFINNPGAGTVQAEIRTKQGIAPSGYASVYFPLLVMAGGQFDNGNPGFVDIQGQVEIVSNAIFYTDTGGGTARGIRIDAYITGSNNIEYHDFDTTMNGGLTIGCSSNTYSGTWNVVQGPLIGAVTNSLGTNSITVAANGALETYYNLNDSTANLILGGVMYLHQADTFYTLVLGNNALSAGTYTAAQLCSTYPRYFPSNWLAHASTQNGATNASGSITVLASLGATVLQNPTPAAVSVYPTQSAQFTAQGGGNPPLYYQWQLNGVALTDNANFIGSLSNVISIVNITNAEAGNYTIIVSNSLGSTTSAPAILTVLPTQPPIIPITTSTFEGQNTDWETTGIWNDGQGGLPATQSALEFPGSTYEVDAGALLRSISNAVSSVVFPGVSLQIDGAGTLINGPAAGGTAQGELRLKQSVYPQTIYFPLLIINGGQVDNGSSQNYPAILQGKIEILTNASFYVDTSGADGRVFEIDAQLTGSTSIFYHDVNADFAGGLDLTCSSNTYTGTWTVDQGPLLGGGTNSLGTNSITMGPKTAFETLYNVNDPAATLTLNGIFYLHQNDTFYQMAVGGRGVPAGVYTYSQLAALYPTNFPATWTPLYGSTNFVASGSITVLNTVVIPPTINSQPPDQSEEFVGANMSYSLPTSGDQATFQWFLNGSAITAATNSTLKFSSLGGTNVYYCVVSNSAGIATSIMQTNVAMDPPAVVTFDDTANWTLQGAGITPSLSSDVLTLTDNNLNESASAFYDIAQYCEGFNANFTYTPGGSLGADGVTFCIQNAAAGPAALGGGGGNLGYFGINQSEAFQLNIYALATGGVGIGIGTNGSIANPYLGVSPINLASGDPIIVNLYYMLGQMQVALTDTVSSVTFTTNFTITDYGTLVGDSIGYVGFTGADGGSAASQQISNFSFVPAALPVLSMVNAGANCTLSWSGGVLTNMVVQQSANITGPWADAGAVPALVGYSYQVQVAPTNSATYFRLNKE